MKTLQFLLTLLLASTLSYGDDLKTKLGLISGSKIFFGGDSIESSNMYSHYIVAWFYLTYPDLDLKIYHFGASGTPAGDWAAGEAASATPPAFSLFERYAKVFNPDVVLFKNGTNGGYSPTVHMTVWNNFVANWITPVAGRKLMMIGQWGSQSNTDSSQMKAKGELEAAYAAATDRVFHAPVWPLIGNAWRLNGTNQVDIQQVGVLPNIGTRDFIHPGPAGHFVTAWATLKAMGAEILVSRGEVSALSNTITGQAQCTLSNLAMTPTGGTFKRLDQRLPWAYDVNGRGNGNLFAQTYGIDDGTLQDWQEYLLKINGLTDGIYDVYCDGEKIGTKTAAELAAGWNMAGLEKGPVFRQVQEVLGEVRDMQLVDRITLGPAARNHASMYELIPITQALYYGNGLNTPPMPVRETGLTWGGYRGSQYIRVMGQGLYYGGPNLPQALDSELIQIHAASQPVPRTYTISPAGGDPAVVSQDPTCNVQVSMTIPTAVQTVNQPASYTVSVKNLGPSEASNETLTHTYPAGLSINSLSGDTVVQNTAARTITLSSASLAVGASKTFVVNFTPFQKGSLAFSTSATTTTQELNLVDNSVTGAIQVVDVAPSKVTGLRVAKSPPPVTVTSSLGGRIAEALAAPTFPMPPGIPAPSGWGMDPLRGASPDPAVVWANPAAAVTGNYYIDKTNPAATNTSNPYGYPNKPRVSPVDDLYLGPGKLEYFAGGAYDSAGGDNILTTHGAGVAGNPAWVVAAPGVTFAGGYSYATNFLIVDGVKIGRGTGSWATFSFGYSSSNYKIPANHICFRNGQVKDVVQYVPGFGSAVITIGFSGNKSHDMILFNTEILDRGSVQTVRDGIAEDDEHGFHPSQFTYNTWVLGCKIHNVGGDSIQPNGNGAIGDARTRYLYIGYNQFYHNGENAVDSKSARDMVVSSNLCYDFRAGFGSDGTALIAQGEGGTGSENCWYIFNDVSDAAVALRVEEVTPQTIYGIGNVFHDLNGTQQAVYTRIPGAALTFVDNTVSGYPTNALAWDGQGSTAPTVNLHGNIFSGKSGSGAYWIKGDATTNPGSSDYNLYDVANPFLVRWNNATYSTLEAFRTGKAQDAHSIVAAPQFVGGTVTPYALAPGSAAINASVEHSAYATFQSLYGLDIRKDFEGKPRPLGGAWDIGAIEKE